MKKALIISILFFAYLFSKGQFVVAQNQNTFSCSWEPGIETCSVNINLINCSSGFEPNPETCESIKTDSLCFSTVDVPCTRIPTPTSTLIPTPTHIPCKQFNVNFRLCEEYVEEYQYTCKEEYAGGFRICCPSPEYCEDYGGLLAGPTSSGSITVTPTPPDRASGEPQGNSYIEGNLCDDGNGLNTALGCIPFSVDGLVGFFLKNLMGLVGSVALIMIVYGSFLVMTSSGSPDKVAQGKEIITAAISGLLFAILSIFILRLIGVTWLQLPGLN